MPKLTMSQIKSKIMNAPVGGAQLTDLPIDGSFKIESNDAGNLFLKPAKGARVNITERGLAALSIAESADAIKDIIDTNSARESGKVGNLQTALSDENAELTDDTKLVVIHKLRRLNQKRPTEYLFKNRFYTGHSDYTAVTGKIRADKELTDDERTQKYADAAQALRETALVAPAPTVEDKNLLLTPVFMLVSK